MNIERYLRMLAGTFVLITLAPGYFVNPYWFLFSAFVALNLIQPPFTRWCPMVTFLKRFGAGQ